MIRPAPLSRALMLIPSSAMIGVFFLIPFALIVLASLSGSGEDGGISFSFDTAQFERAANWFYIERTLFSAGLCAVIAAAALVIAFPFTYMLTGFSERVRSLWLIYILAQLSLSEVLIAFSWQILLSKTSGLSHLLVWLGLSDETFAMAPSAGAVAAALIYLAVPFAVLLLYPALSRMDRSLVEAARTLGSSTPRSFFTVVVPVCRQALVSSGVTIFVLTLGAIIVPQVLGRPEHWTLSVLITDQAIFNFDLPFASALAVVLLAVSAMLVGLAMRLGREAAE